MGNNESASRMETDENAWNKLSKQNQKRLKIAVRTATAAVEKVIRKDNVSMDPGHVGYITRPDVTSGTLSDYVDVENKASDPPACKAPKAKAYKQCEAWLDTAYDACSAGYTSALSASAAVVASKDKAVVASKDKAVAKVAEKFREDRIESDPANASAN